jgi:1-acyl-sn-glycerol-3-phosphate acyltransferase
VLSHRDTIVVRGPARAGQAGTTSVRLTVTATEGSGGGGGAAERPWRQPAGVRRDHRVACAATLPSVKDRVYPAVILGFRLAFRALGLRISVEGVEHVPAQGGAVLAANHVSYLDFTFVGWGARPRRRLVRFMAKEAVFRHRISGPLMRGMHHIPVDRAAGSQAFRDALAMLKAGEVVGIFPEATISRSFVLKDFKPGAVRLTQAAGVPLVPTVVWGGQRLYTKGRRPDVRRRGKAITIAFGEPLVPGRRDDPAEVEAELRRRMGALLEQAQKSYPDTPSGPDDRWWLPAALGGTAPTPEEAAAMDAADAQTRHLPD